METEIIEKIRENLIQGRKSEEDEGIDETLNGTPGVIELTEEALEKGVSPKEIISLAITPGMEAVGEKYDSGEYFIPDMLASAQAAGAAMEILKPHLEKARIASKGRVAVATVKDDIHDIGKNIVVILLKGAGYDVDDLGIDVSTEKIVEEVKTRGIEYLGLSALLTSTMTRMKEVIEALDKAGLKGKVRVLIGGAAVSQEYADEIGADAYCADGFQAISAIGALKQQ
ncbi:MAG: cobalamin-dependent protein [Dehalococcoidaceae bacterium]|nr:cobalamin-dependent protein [Dehalococcoidaceae bacterium]